jgi:hypothetical protein
MLQDLKDGKEEKAEKDLAKKQERKYLVFVNKAERDGNLKKSNEPKQSLSKTESRDYDDLLRLACSRSCLPIVRQLLSEKF